MGLCIIFYITFSETTCPKTCCDPRDYSTNFGRRGLYRCESGSFANHFKGRVEQGLPKIISFLLWTCTKWDSLLPSLVFPNRNHHALYKSILMNWIPKVFFPVYFVFWRGSSLEPSSADVRIKIICTKKHIWQCLKIRVTLVNFSGRLNAKLVSWLFRIPKTALIGNKQHS